MAGDGGAASAIAEACRAQIGHTGFTNFRLTGLFRFVNVVVGENRMDAAICAGRRKNGQACRRRRQ